jgi:hypothetical protein
LSNAQSVPARFDSLDFCANILAFHRLSYDGTSL